MMAAISLEALAQARYALFEKHIRACESRATARTVFPADSVNVKFWEGECSRIVSALTEFGGPQ